MEHLDRILAEPNDIKLLISKEWLNWWNWTPYIETWRILDEDASTPARDLPLFDMTLRVFHVKNMVHPHLSNEEYAEWGMEKFKKLYKTIKEEGYDQDKEKRVSVEIGTNGELKLRNGYHRISMLKHLNHPPVLVDVISRHHSWISLKSALFNIYNKKLLYQPIDHPDFADWEVDRPSPHRLETIKSSLGDVTGVTVLDVGSCTGYFSIKLAQEGAQVTGVEPHKKRHVAAKVLARYEGLTEDNPVFLMESFEKHLQDNRYDVCLVLSVLHHYFRSDPEEFYKAVSTISNSCDKMMLEMGVNRMPIPWNPDLVLEHSKYRKYTTLYDGERPIYLYTL